jgi:hypothetical protein
MHFFWWIAASADDEVAQSVLLYKRTGSRQSDSKSEGETPACVVQRMPPICVVDEGSVKPVHSGRIDVGTALRLPPR